jgi:uncharacterized integral membrane protein (TIGR00697 family)
LDGSKHDSSTGLYSVFTGVFVASLLIANVTSHKIFELGPFTLPAGTIVFPISFIFGDILTEVYGFARTRKVIWIGFGCQALAALTYLIVGALPPAEFWHDSEAFDRVLGFVPRIVVASIIAYWMGEFCNSVVLSRMKARARGARGIQQALRFVASTVAGQAVDSAVFVLIAYAGVYGSGELAWSAVSLYLFKVVYEALLTPITIRFANWVKRVEGVDHIDDPRTTSYNPFSLGS